MSIQVQFRRGNTAQNNAFTGVVGEISVDTTTNTIRVHDGSTAGGFTTVSLTAAQTLTNKTISAPTLTGNIVGNITTASNISGNYILGNGACLTGVITSVANINNGTSNISIATSGGNIAVVVNNTALLSFTSGGIINNLSNGTGNIGNASGYFNTVFAKSTSAQYADLAEMYEADAIYEPGTVMSFGGEQQVTLSKIDSDRRVAGVVSTSPSYLMNSVCSGLFPTPIALTGLVPTKVTGTLRKGDMVVSNGDGTARAEDNPSVGSVIGKSLEDFNGPSGVVNIVVGRF